MKVGDIIEARHGEIGMVISVEYMYPTHPQSPASRVKVDWISEPPQWCPPGLMFSTFAIKRVVSRASR